MSKYECGVGVIPLKCSEINYKTACCCHRIALPNMHYNLVVSGKKILQYSAGYQPSDYSN